MTDLPAAPHDTLTTGAITHWIEGYVRAWETNEPSAIAQLFTKDAEYHETPYETSWIGRDEIIAGWRSRWDWQEGGWNFDWSIAAITGRTARITGDGRYVELGDFDNEWTVSFDEAGRCTRFDMVNTERTAA